MGKKALPSLADAEELTQIATTGDDFNFGGITGTMTQEEHERKKIRSKKISISLPEDVLDDLQKVASIRRMNTSQAIQLAVRQYLNNPEMKKLIDKYNAFQ